MRAFKQAETKEGKMTSEYHAPYSEEGVWGDFTYGAPGVSRGLINMFQLTQSEVSFSEEGTPKTLIIGSGIGWELAYLRINGWDAYGIDLYIPDMPLIKKYSVQGDASNMPYKDNEFGLVVCCETFEHIPEDVCWDILKEIKRISKNFYFTIATIDDAPVYSTHITIYPAWWWMQKIEEHGMNIKHAEAGPKMNLVYAGNRLLRTRYEEGVTIYGSCNLEKQEIP
jgi:hypothetical protein